MLQKDPAKRITVVGCLEHPWFKMNQHCHPSGDSSSCAHESHTKIIQRLKDFRTPQRL
jgi:calcium-dependent protein kinase